MVLPIPISGGEAALCAADEEIRKSIFRKNRQAL